MKPLLRVVCLGLVMIGVAGLAMSAATRAAAQEQGVTVTVPLSFGAFRGVEAGNGYLMFEATDGTVRLVQAQGNGVLVAITIRRQ